MIIRKTYLVLKKWQSIMKSYFFDNSAESHTYVTSDLHAFPFDETPFSGSIEHLLKITRFSKKDKLYILGDIIDRGNDVLNTLRFIMNHKENVFVILGNHEKMLLDCKFMFEPELKDPDTLSGSELARFKLWMFNGGRSTYNALRTISRNERQRIFEYFSSCPTYIEITVKGIQYILVHSGLGSFSPEKELHEYSEDELLWSRPTMSDRYYFKERNKYVVFGHTPVQLLGAADNAPIINLEGGWIDIDTGSALGYGPVFLRLEDFRVFYPFQ